MVNIAVEDGTASHTGTVCGGPVASTLNLFNQSFVTIAGQLVMVEGDEVIVPSHLNPPCEPPPYGHTYVPDTFQQSFVTIEGKTILVVDDTYAGDPTHIDDAGSNTFVSIS